MPAGDTRTPAGSVEAHEPAAAPDDRVVIREQNPTVRAMIAETWRLRSLIPRLGPRQLVKGYSITRIGAPWLVLRPLVSVLAMALVFGSVLQAPSEGVPYLLFLLVGMTCWLVIERTVFWGTRSFDIYRRVASRLEVPALLVPTSAVTLMTIEFTVMGLLTLCTATFYGLTEGDFYIGLGPDLALAACGVLLALTLGWGITLWLAPLNARARDVRLTLSFVLPVWLYVTPVIYPTSALPERWQFIATVNPAVAPVELMKKGVLGVGTTSTASIVVSLVTAVLLVASGLWFITRMASHVHSALPDFDELEDEAV